mmetsp:Transcript_1248/g.3490  ORF Transcript_1248/g.3490 Transcript_1248/m.3490 type:complete len:265 (+) Transcript_1248:1271-2065(+)
MFSDDASRPVTRRRSSPAKRRDKTSAAFDDAGVHVERRTAPPPQVPRPSLSEKLRVHVLRGRRPGERTKPALRRPRRGHRARGRPGPSGGRQPDPEIGRPQLHAGHVRAPRPPAARGALPAAARRRRRKSADEHERAVVRGILRALGPLVAFEPGRVVEPVRRDGRRRRRAVAALARSVSVAAAAVIVAGAERAVVVAVTEHAAAHVAREFDARARHRAAAAVAAAHADDSVRASDRRRRRRGQSGRRRQRLTARPFAGPPRPY